MNKTPLLFGLAVATCLLVPIARADVSATDGLGTWEGSGIASDVAGTQQTPFTVTLVRRGTAANVVRTDGTIHMKDGKDVTFWDEHVEQAGGACTVTGSLGHGGGRCFANHMCQLYVDRGDGHAFATTIAIDSAEKMRVLVTELENGKAARFFSQQLVKKP
jgi:hypothetical protein